MRLHRRKPGHGGVCPKHWQFQMCHAVLMVVRWRRKRVTGQGLHRVEAGGVVFVVVQKRVEAGWIIHCSGSPMMRVVIRLFRVTDENRVVVK